MSIFVSEMLNGTKQTRTNIIGNEKKTKITSLRNIKKY